jgi:hypothetical protein
MNKAIYTIVFMTLLAFFSRSLAQETPLVFSGTISEVDNVARAIVVMGKGEAMLFSVPEDTTIKMDYGKDVPFAALKKGMSVSVEYIKEGNDIHPLKIKINTGPSGFGKKQKEKQEEQKKKK